MSRPEIPSERVARVTVVPLFELREFPKNSLASRRWTMRRSKFSAANFPCSSARMEPESQL